MILDGVVITAPVIRSAITGGSGIITGSFTSQEASNLAVLLRAGALPAPLSIIEERSVGPGLGADSITSGKIASLIGMICVCIFMFYFFRAHLFVYFPCSYFCCLCVLASVGPFGPFQFFE